MSFFSHLGHSISHLAHQAVHGVESVGKTAVHGVESAGETAVHGVEGAGTTVARGVESGSRAVVHTFSAGVDAAGHAFQKVETAAKDIAVTGAHEIESGLKTEANRLERSASGAFDAAVNSGRKAFNNVKHDIEKAIADGEAKIIGPAAERIVNDLIDDIKTVKDAWAEISDELSGDIETVKRAALARHITSQAEESFEKISKELGPALSKFFSKSYASFGIQFGASAAYGVAGEVGLGVIAGLPNITNVRGYGSVGVTVGVEAGAEADISLVFNLSAPENTGGASLNVVISVEAEVGGTVVVSFSIPHFRLSGISIGLGGGEEAGVSVGGGYRFLF